MTKKYYIYKITNVLSEKVYIGQSIEPKRRWKTHQRLALKQLGNQYIHRAMNKYGPHNFSFEVIEEHNSLEDCNRAEAKQIEDANAQDKEFGYNIKPGGRKKGWKHTEETKAKQSENWHKVHREDGIKEAHEANRGRKLSEEHIEAIRQANIRNKRLVGHKQSQEQIDKRVATIAKNYGSKVCNAPNCERTDGSKVGGIRYCNMHEQRMRKHGTTELSERVAHNKGQPLSDETKAKLSAALKGRKVHNRIEFTEEQTNLITSYTISAESLAKKFGVSGNVIKRVRRENKY